MTKTSEKLEKVFEDIAYAESGEYNPLHKKPEEHDSLEEIFSAIGMAEGGDEEYAKRLHHVYHITHRKN